jgi:membrane protein DedA with SNARE-associated domain
MIDSMMQNAAWVLFLWVLANQAGVPVPVFPSLLAAGTLAADGHLNVVVVLATAVAAALGADLVWYGLGRWYGIRSLTALVRLARRPSTSVLRIQHVFRTHQLRVVWSARFLPELNPIAAGLAGATGVALARFLPHAAGSALVWAGTLTGAGYLLGGAITRSPARFNLALTVLLGVALAAVLGGALAVRRWRRSDRPAGPLDTRTWWERLGRPGDGNLVDTPHDLIRPDTGRASDRSPLIGTVGAA